MTSTAGDTTDATQTHGPVRGIQALSLERHAQARHTAVDRCYSTHVLPSCQLRAGTMVQSPKQRSSVPVHSHRTHRAETALESGRFERKPHSPGRRSTQITAIQPDERINKAATRYAAPSAHAYAHGRLTNDNTGQSAYSKIMMDQGNLVKTGVAISEAFFQKLGLRYERLSRTKVGTACKGAQMTLIGWTEPFSLRFDGVNRIFSIKAAVFSKLSDDINIGQGFLQQLPKMIETCGTCHTGTRPQLEFHPDGTTLRLAKDKVEFITNLKTRPITVDDQAHAVKNEIAEMFRESRIDARVRQRMRETSVGARKPGTTPIYTSEAKVLPANSLCFIPVDRTPSDMLVEPPTLGSPPLCRVVPGIYNRTTRIGILNLGPQQTLHKGVQIAEMTPSKLAPRAVPESETDPAPNAEDATEQLFKDLRLDSNPILQANPEMMAKTKELVSSYRDVFSSPEHEIGKTSLIEFQVQLKPDTKPVKQKVRPLNPHQKADLKAQLELWEREDVIEETESPWASALVPALKKGGAIRWAVDYRRVNEATIADSYPLPSIQDNLDKLQGSKVFSTLDAASAYNTIPVQEKSRPLLAFTTPFGLYTFKRMPFGAKNAGATYCRFMELLVQKLRSPWVLCYLDDIIVHTHTLEQHLEQLQRTLHMHRDAGIKLRAHKSHLFRETADYLGFRVTHDGIEMKPEYVDKILKWPTPTTPKELSSFLGFCGYYRTFIKDFSKLTGEMDAQKRKKTLDWTEEMDENFKTLKKLFGQKPIRAYPLFHEDAAKFEVRPDFSGRNLGAVLEQVQDGQRRFIAAIGRKTTKGESNYPPTKGELAAIMYALRKWEHILRYKPFLLFTDHQALKWLSTMKSPRGIYWRWIAELATYNYDLGWSPGKAMGCADGLSRSNHMDEPTPEEEAESEEFVGKIGKVDPTKGIHAIQLDMAAIRQAQEQDEVLQIVRKWVKGQPPDKEELRGKQEEYQTYFKYLKSLYIDEGGVLMMRYLGGQPLEDQRDRIAIPEQQDLRDEVFRWSHCHPSAGHFGESATAMRASLKFFWPGMIGYLKRQVKKCGKCLAKQQKVDTKQTVHQPRRHGYPGEVLYVDLVGPLPESAKGDKYVLTMQDGFSKFAVAYPIPCKEAAVVANQLIEGWLTKYGCPTRIHTDQGKEFENKLWANLMDRLEIQKTATPAYNPHSNLVERFHRSLNQILRVYMQREEKSWDRYISTACFAYNTKVNETSGVTPFEAWMGRPAKLPIDLVLPTPQKRYDNESAYIEDTMRRFEVMFGWIKRNSEARFRRNAKGYTGNPTQFQVGDLVWCYTKRKVPGKPGKITDAWLGPYEVVEKPADVLLTVKPATTQGRAIVVHITRVRLYQGPRDDQKHRPPIDPVGDDDGDELAEELSPMERWAQPKDNLALPIVVPDEPPPMVDLPRRYPDQEDPDGAGPEPPDGAGPSNPTQGETNKRDRESDREPGNHQKRGRRQAERRTAPAPHTRVTRSKARWQELVAASSTESSSSTEVESEGEIQQLDEGPIVTVPPGIEPPTRGTPGSAGWDCRANQTVTLYPGRTAKVDLGLRLAIPPGYVMLLFSRSRLAAEGVTVQGGVIDSDYRGSVQCLLHNSTANARRIQKGERVCQALFTPVPEITWMTVEQLDVTDRNEAGFGSTGC